MQEKVVESFVCYSIIGLVGRYISFESTKIYFLELYLKTFEDIWGFVY